MTSPVPERVDGFGLYNFSVSPVLRPASLDELREAVAECRRRGLRWVFRGAGRSYGDAATNPDGPVIELKGLSAIKSFDEETGIVVAEPGVTMDALWRYAVPRGFWPPVVPGTAITTLGGCVAMNIHGKNNWKMGTLGEHVACLRVLRPDGSLATIEKGSPELLDVVSGWGRPTAVVEVTLKLKRVPTGWLDVTAVPTRDLSATLVALDEAKEREEYLVGWMDCFASGKGLGRSVVHLASGHVAKDGEPKGFTVEEQLRGLPAARVVPLLLLGLKTMAFDSGMRLVNAAKHRAAALKGEARYRQSLVTFSFLLDYIPGWNAIYLPGGFIQYQMFLPKESAEPGFAEAIRLQHERGVVSYLGVVKRHRPDRFVNTHAVDGFSLAMDFPVTRKNTSRLIHLCRAFDALVLRSAGRLYKAKDCVGSVERLAAMRKANAT